MCGRSSSSKCGSTDRLGDTRLTVTFRLMMGMIGFTVGFIGFLLHNVVDLIEEPILERSLGYG